VLGKSEICAAHVIEGRRHWWFDAVISLTSGLDFDDDLQRTLEAIEQAPERIQPSVAVAFGCVGEPKPSGLNKCLL
jgi:hypothetical protein